MKTSLSTLTPVLACLLVLVLVPPGQSLKCSCNTDRMTVPCIDDVCEMMGHYRDNTSNEVLYPYCAAIRHPIRGDYLACGYAAKREINSKCDTEKMPQENVTIDKCWCNTGDLCNENMMFPIEYEEDHEEEGNQSSSVAISTATQTIRHVTDESTIPSTTVPHMDIGDTFRTAKETDSTTDHSIVTDTLFQAHRDGEAVEQVQESDEIEERIEAETSVTSIDTERVTPSMNEITRGVMQDTHSSVQDSLRTDYLKPEEKAAKTGAMYSGQEKRGPTSTNKANTVGRCGHSFLRLAILAFLLMAAF